MNPILIPNTFDLQRLVTKDGKKLFTSNNLALYAQNAHPTIPENNGIGILDEAISCTVLHELNGQYELELVYPCTGRWYNDIQFRCLIIAKPDRRSGNQPFRVYRITQPIDGNITIYARHISYDLSGIVIKPFVATDIQSAMAGMKANAMTNMPFTFRSSRTTSAKFSPKVPTSAWELMGGTEGSLLDVYGGEYSFDEYDISLENRIGEDNGVKVRYGVNMTDFEQDKSCASCYTGIVAYWQYENDVVYSPVVNASGSFDYVRILPVDMSMHFEEKPTSGMLKAAAIEYIKANKIGVPDVSWKINFVPLDSTEEYRHIPALEVVGLGDTVGVEFEKLKVDATSRVVSIEWDVILERYITLYLGRVKSNITDTIVGQAKELSGVPNIKQVASVATDVFQNQMSGYKSSGDVGQGFGDCSAAFDGQVLKGWQESTGIPLWQIGSAVSYFGDSYIASGDIKLYAIGEGIDSSRPAIWVGSDGDAWGIVVRDTYTGYNGSVSMIFTPDFGILFTIHDDDGNQTLSIQQNGLLRAKEIKCDRLIVNGHEIT